MPLGPRQLIPAMVLALVLHAALGLWAFWQALNSGAVGSGSGGVEMNLGMAGGAAGFAPAVDAAEVSEVPAEQAEVFAPEPPETLVPPPDSEPPPPVPAELAKAAVEPPQTAPPLSPQPALPKEAPPVDPVTTKAEPLVPVQSISPEPAPQLAALAETLLPLPAAALPAQQVIETEETRETGQTTAVTPPRPVEKPTPPKRKAPQRQKTAAKSETAKPPAISKPAVVDKTAKAESAAPTAPSASAGAMGQGGTSGGARNTGHADQAAAGGNPGARRDYVAQLAAILTRYKRYPRRAKSRRQQGVGQLYFAVDATGRVIASSLRASSGHQLLDDEILAMVARVGRFPPIPADLGQSRVDVVVPIRFSLR